MGYEKKQSLGDGGSDAQSERTGGAATQGLPQDGGTRVQAAITLVLCTDVCMHSLHELHLDACLWDSCGHCPTHPVTWAPIGETRLVFLSYCSKHLGAAPCHCDLSTQPSTPSTDALVSLGPGWEMRLCCTATRKRH